MIIIGCGVSGLHQKLKEKGLMGKHRRKWKIFVVAVLNLIERRTIRR